MYKDKITIFLLTITCFFSCRKTDQSGVQPIVETKRLVLVYMVADNNLDYFAVKNINDMEAGMTPDFQGKLLVFVDRGNNATPSHPYMLEIVYDTTPLVVSKIVYTYPETNSATATALTAAVRDAKSYYPSFSSMGLVLWSHGTAWLPKGVDLGTKRGQIIDSTRSFGLDNTPQDSAVMDIKNLGTALKSTGIFFDFILFDACYMGAVEVAYELKNTAQYMIAASTEILSYGFPYKTITPLLGAKEVNISAITRSFYDYYDAQKGILQSCSIAAVELKNMDDFTAKINSFFSQMAAIKDSCLVNLKTMQRLDFAGDTAAPPWAFDLKYFLETLRATANNSSLNTAFNNVSTQWNSTVLYNQHTNWLFKTIDLKNCNGLSTYIPNALKDKIANEYYQTLSWYKASGYDKLAFVYRN